MDLFPDECSMDSMPGMEIFPHTELSHATGTPGCQASGLRPRGLGSGAPPNTWWRPWSFLFGVLAGLNCEYHESMRDE